MRTSDWKLETAGIDFLAALAELIPVTVHNLTEMLVLCFQLVHNFIKCIMDMIRYDMIRTTLKFHCVTFHDI